MAASTVTLYNILGVAKASDDVQLRITYRERIHQFKADRQKTPGNRTITAEQFRQICRAYERLSDHDKRKRYDERQEWISDLYESKYTLQQLAVEPYLELQLKQRLQNNIQEHIDVQYHVQRQTLLHCACKKGHFDLAKWLIEARSAKLDLVDINLNSALHLAAYGGHTSIVQYLLYRGANSTLINKWGMTAEQEGIVHGTRITGCGLKQ
ncbi:unnamed protein product [Rotaria sp. Silwood1]|nr:unnamed protein product [Rotaria sp. Silwood1]CAF3673323.1 unnamed protein product [Rotaria sp. Silwood1]CAF4836222.1 unnamed protein product [Rotaria sp. Silwood1]